jgi:two-component system chemotaxis response regulator CheY
MRVLAVDDSATMRRIIKNQLEQSGVENVDEAENGREALSLLGRGRYDLLITDWNMPQMTGLALVLEVRKTEPIKGIPILMITTVSAKEDIVNALKAGVNNYVVKPFDAATLQAKVTQLVGAPRRRSAPSRSRRAPVRRSRSTCGAARARRRASSTPSARSRA